MFKLAMFCLGSMFAVIPLAAAAQDASSAPTPAPVERFVMVDGTITGKTFNELTPGASTGGWGIRAAAEVPVIGHDWMASVDFRQYDYTHTAPATMGNGFTSACPAGNSGCITPIGYQTSMTPSSPPDR